MEQEWGEHRERERGQTRSIGTHYWFPAIWNNRSNTLFSQLNRQFLVNQVNCYSRWLTSRNSRTGIFYRRKWNCRVYDLWISRHGKYIWYLHINVNWNFVFRYRLRATSHTERRLAEAQKFSWESVKIRSWGRRKEIRLNFGFRPKTSIYYYENQIEPMIVPLFSFIFNTVKLGKFDFSRTDCEFFLLVSVMWI